MLIEANFSDSACILCDDRTTRGHLNPRFVLPEGFAAVVQSAVYKMSSAGSFIDEGDFSQASVVLGSDWVKDLKAATAKVRQKYIASASKI